jgi:hypothetical protein
MAPALARTKAGPPAHHSMGDVPLDRLGRESSSGCRLACVSDADRRRRSSSRSARVIARSLSQTAWQAI